ncbi:MAG: hypothetical protein JWO13_2897 [Acidobacteriales bacterium]|nr:hypothetical protein [Terriglobales bacterium]
MLPRQVPATKVPALNCRIHQHGIVGFNGIVGKILSLSNHISARSLVIAVLLAGSAMAQKSTPVPSTPPPAQTGAAPEKSGDDGSDKSVSPDKRFGRFNMRRRGDGRSAAPPAGQWLRRYHNLPPQQQQNLLSNDPQFQKLPPTRQEQLRGQLKEFNSRSPEQQQRMLDRMAKFENMSDEQKQQLEKLHQRMHEIPEGRRAVVRREFQLLQQLTPDQRQRVMSSDSYHTTFSDGEREIIKGMTDIQASSGDADGPPPDSPEFF